MFINYAFIFFRIVSTTLIHNGCPPLHPLHHDSDTVNSLLVELERVDVSNNQRMVLLQSFKRFIILNMKTIKNKFVENHWIDMEGKEPLHLALKNILLQFSRYQQEIINIVIVHIATFISSQTI